MIPFYNIQINLYNYIVLHFVKYLMLQTIFFIFAKDFMIFKMNHCMKWTWFPGKLSNLYMILVRTTILDCLLSSKFQFQKNTYIPFKIIINKLFIITYNNIDKEDWNILSLHRSSFVWCEMSRGRECTGLNLKWHLIKNPGKKIILKNYTLKKWWIK